MRKSWAEKRRELTDQIIEGVRTFVESDGWTKYLETAAKFHRYSFGNQMLILPTAAYKWSEEDGEKEKVFTGRKFWPVVSVFGVSQTEGELLQDVVVTLDAEGIEQFHKSLLGYAEQEGIPVEDGFLGQYGATDGNGVFINDENPVAQQAKTLVHEFAHIKLEHLNGRDVPRAQQELEAESVAYIVCSACGLDTSQYTFGYLASWAKGDPEVVEKAIRESGELISKVAKGIIEGVADGLG